MSARIALVLSLAACHARHAAPPDVPVQAIAPPLAAARTATDQLLTAHTGFGGFRTMLFLSDGIILAQSARGAHLIDPTTGTERMLGPVAEDESLVHVQASGNLVLLELQPERGPWRFVLSTRDGTPGPPVTGPARAAPTLGAQGTRILWRSGDGTAVVQDPAAAQVFPALRATARPTQYGAALSSDGVYAFVFDTLFEVASGKALWTADPADDQYRVEDPFFERDGRPWLHYVGREHDVFVDPSKKRVHVVETSCGAGSPWLDRVDAEHGLHARLCGATLRYVVTEDVLRRNPGTSRAAQRTGIHTYQIDRAGHLLMQRGTYVDDDHPLPWSSLDPRTGATHQLTAEPEPEPVVRGDAFTVLAGPFGLCAVRTGTRRGDCDVELSPDHVHFARLKDDLLTVTNAMDGRATYAFGQPSAAPPGTGEPTLNLRVDAVGLRLEAGHGNVVESTLSVPVRPDPKRRRGAVRTSEAPPVVLGTLADLVIFDAGKLRAGRAALVVDAASGAFVAHVTFGWDFAFAEDDAGHVQFWGNRALASTWIRCLRPDGTVVPFAGCAPGTEATIL